MKGASVVRVQDVRFRWAHDATDVLDIASFSVAPGEAVFLHGASGCGKSTLLSLVAGVLMPREGRTALLEQDWQALSGGARDRLRVDHVGYIFQQFNLLPYLSVMDNVLLPCRFSRLREWRAVQQAGSAREAAERLLLRVGLDSALWPRAALALSVGQQQRVAAARALIGSPDLVVADEPTSALDEERKESFLDMLLAACATTGSALLFVSHDRRSAGRFARIVDLPTINRARSAVAT